MPSIHADLRRYGFPHPNHPFPAYQKQQALIAAIVHRSAHFLSDH
jgi:hypothetical protein